MRMVAGLNLGEKKNNNKKSTATFHFVLWRKRANRSDSAKWNYFSPGSNFFKHFFNIWIHWRRRGHSGGQFQWPVNCLMGGPGKNKKKQGALPGVMIGTHDKFCPRKSGLGTLQCLELRCPFFSSLSGFLWFGKIW